MRKPSFFITIITLCCVFLGGNMAEKARAHGFIIVDHPVIVPLPHPPHPPHPPIFPPHPRPPRPIHKFLPLEVRKHHVSVKIKGQIATTSVEQSFYNPSRQRLEGTYIFPIPRGSRIDKFQMDVNGKMTAAELLDAKKARNIYEEIVRKAKDPALMEYSDQGMFKVRIFPIEPGKEKHIKIKYTQLLKRDGRITEYIYPLNTEKFSSRPIKSISLKTTIESEKEIKSIYSPSHEIDVTRDGKKRAVVGFEETNATPDTDFKLFFAAGSSKEAPIGLELLTYQEKEKKEGYYMLMLSPGAWENEKLVPKDIIFAIDTSGSMRVKKLDQAKAALDFCIDNLNEEDRFEIIRYSTESEALFDKLSPTKSNQIKEAKQFVERLKAGGGTAIEEALIMAIESAAQRQKSNADRPFQVVFLTDGRPTIGETRTDKIISRLVKAKEKVKGAVRIFSFGIGTDINTKLLDRISEETKASTEYVLPEENIEHKVSRFYAKISQPVMADLKLRTEGEIRLSQRHPNALPDLFKGDQLVVFGRYNKKKENKDDIVVFLEGRLAGERKTFNYEATFDGKSKHGFIPRLWATRRVGYLLDEIRLHGEKKELKTEVVLLARRWGIVTPYTSYLIIEDEESRGVPVARQSMGNRTAVPASPGSTPSLGIEARTAFADEFGGKESTAKAKNFQRQLERDTFRGFTGNDSGDGAVAAARASGQLKRASQTKVYRQAYRESQYGNRIQFEQQATKTIAGKTFYQNGNTWIDSKVPEESEKEIKRIQFGSKEYFNLLAQSNNVAKWLSVAANLRIVIGNDLYEILSTESE